MNDRARKMIIPDHDDGPEAEVRLPLIAGREYRTWLTLSPGAYKTWQAHIRAVETRGVETKAGGANED